MRIKVDKHIENADWLIEVRRQRLETKLAKHYGPGKHPGTGTEQDAHGKGVTPFTDRVAGFENSLSSLPEEVGKKILTKADEHIGSREEILARFRTLIDAAAEDPEASARWWYEEKHDHLSRVAEEFGHHPNRYIAATAVISSGMEWEKNVRMADMLAQYLGEDATLYSTLGDIEVVRERVSAYAARYDLEFEGMDESTRPSDLSSTLAAVAFQDYSKHMGDSYPARYGYATLSQAVSIMRGEQTMDDVNGLKRRSFYNNLLALDGDDDVTIDVQMLGAASWKNLGNDSRFEGFLISSPKYLENEIGVRPYIADLVREITAEYNTRKDDPWEGLLPRQVQAIIWAEFKNQLGRFGTER